MDGTDGRDGMADLAGWEKGRSCWLESDYEESDVGQLKKRIEETELPEDVKTEATREVKRLAKLPPTAQYRFANKTMRGAAFQGRGSGSPSASAS